MKKLFLSLAIAMLFISSIASAQTPQGINYQAVARNSAGGVLSNSSISLRISILDKTATGTSVFTETHAVTTNALGLFTFVIGKGTLVSGDFTKIDWSTNDKFLEVEMDSSGGSSYTVMGTSQLVSVPYALYADKAGNAKTYNAGSGISISNDSIINTSKDQKVSLTGTGGTSISGTYPSFTIKSTVYNPGKGISISNDSIINTAPDQKVTIAGGGASAITGSYPNFTVSSSDSTMWKRNGSSNIYYSGGNVGIGKNNPVNKLDVKGPINGDSIMIGGLTEISRKGTNNLFIGVMAGRLNTASQNQFIGDSAGFNNTTGNQSTVLGYKALYSNTSGWFNVANGYHSLYSNTTGYNNVAVGWSSLSNNSTGNTNTAVGVYALTSTIGSGNTAIGGFALIRSTTGIYNTASGVNALSNNKTGNYNTADGNDAMLYNKSGNRNTSVGNEALNSNTSGEHNVAMGNQSGTGNTTGSGNTLIGDSSNVGSNNLSNATALGYGATVSQSNSLVLGNGANVGIGITGPQVPLDVTGMAIFRPAKATFPSSGGSYVRIGYDTTNSWGYLASDNTSAGYRNLRIDANPLQLNPGSKGNVLIANGGGYVGIGTTTPGSPLTLEAGSKFAPFTINKTGGASNDMIAFNVKGNAIATFGARSGGEIFFYHVKTSSFNFFMDSLGNVGIGAYTPTRQVFKEKFTVNGRVESTNGGFKFPDGTVQTTAARDSSQWITSGSNIYYNGGNIGIGTSSPSSKVHIKTSSSSGLDLTNENTSGYAEFLARGTISGATVDAVLFAETKQAGVGTNTKHPFYVRTNNLTRMWFDTAGNVGIGTTSPSTKLEVKDGYVRINQTDGAQASLILNGSYSTNRASRIDFLFKDSTTSRWSLIKDYTQNGTDRFDFEFGGARKVTIAGTTGNVGIGTANPSQKLSVSGNICYTGSIGSCSDRRYKTNILSMGNMLTNVMALAPVTYNWKVKEFPDKNFNDKKQLGFIAQDIEKIFPELVLTDNDGYKSVDYVKITPILVKAVQEQQSEIEALKKQNELILAKLNSLESGRNKASASIK